MSQADDEPELSLVMPFVVCQSNGGPHQDDAFVSGFECGSLDARLCYEQPPLLELTMRTDSLPQIDLIAMNRGYHLKSEPWAEYPDDWVFVSLLPVKET